jgi:hypothetical protein
MQQQRSKSVPKERGPRAVHKNSIQYKSPQQQDLQKQQPGSFQVQKLNLQSVRPASPSNRPGSAYSNRSSAHSPFSVRSTDSPRDESFDNISEDHVGFSTNRGTTGAHTRAGGSGGNDKCVCLICTCGKHHCPPKHVPNAAPLETTTSYTNTFKEHGPGDYPERVKPQQHFFGVRAGPGHFDTTHKQTFVPHEEEHHKAILREKMERAAPRRKIEPPEKFEHTSMHRASYPWHNPDPPIPVRPLTAGALNSGPFYGLTTAKDHFQEWSGADAFSRSREPATLRHSPSPFPDAPIEFGTSYGSNFVQHQIPQKSSSRPRETYSYGSPRNHLTTHQLEFSGRQNPTCPVQGLPPRPASARTGHVRYQLDATGTWR